MNFTSGLPVAFRVAALTWYGKELLDPVLPFRDRLTHGHPDVGVDEVGSLDASGDVVADVNSARPTRPPGLTPSPGPPGTATGPWVRRSVRPFRGGRR